MAIRAIETRYAGYRFRSRLEAKWAVFFDALKIKWDYEPEGFELEKGLYYLPDFLLRRDDDYLWVEVKPFEPNSVDKLKLQLLCDGDEKRPNGCIVHGTPGNSTPVFYSRQAARRHFRDYDRRLPTFWNLALSFADFSPSQRDLDDLFQDAIDAARGARFEHGESGAL